MKKTILILIGIILLAGGVYFFISTKQNNTDLENQGDTSGFRSFFPFSISKNKVDNSIEDTVIEDISDSPNNTEDIATQQNKLSQITDFAVSGFSVSLTERVVENTNAEESAQQEGNVDKKTEEPKTEILETINYVEKSTGHIYEYPLNIKKSEKISNSTIPGVHEAFFGNNNQSVVYRYINDSRKIQSYVATLGATKGEFLSEDIEQIAISPSKEELFYLYNLGDKATGLIFSFKTNTKRQIFSSDFTEWLPQWVNKQAIFLTTKPSWNIEGSLYGLNTTTGALTKIFGNINGLTTLANNEGNRILYNKSTSSGPLLGLFSENNHKSLSIYGLPEKCVWSKDSINIYCAIPKSITTIRLPDLWYQGVVSFDDMFISIDTESGVNNIIDESSIGIDAINLTLSEKEDILFFINKKDGTLWGLSLE